MYVTSPRSLDLEVLAEVATAYAGAGAVLTGLLPLHVLGLRWLPPAEHVHALVPDAVRRPDSGVVRLTRVLGLEQLDTWEWRGWACAPPARAVVDAARRLRLRDARGVVLGAVADRWCTAAEVLDTLGQRNGSAVVRRAALDAARGCASPPEAELVDALIGCGEPFLVNPELRVHGRPIGCPDVWLVRRRVGGEVESRERHETSDGDTESTYDRHERFGEHGVPLVHLSVRRIRRDADEAADHLLRRAVTLPGAPDHVEVVPRGPLLH